ncbi:MAG: peptidase M48, partial [Deltaproteobacteria bacterium]|nr:peptidase M48 [Deltaproteobacteria bacterium]
VDFLQRGELNFARISRHHRKVYGALLLYVAVLCGAGVALWQMPDDLLQRAPLDHLAKLYLEKTEEEPQNPLWFQLLGDLQQGRRQYVEAMASYEKALLIARNHPEVLNNLAWILLTAEDWQFVDPARALMLARAAAGIKQAGYILDTLALAYWQNGYAEKARQAEKMAIEADPDNREYYEKQLGKYEGQGNE